MEFVERPESSSTATPEDSDYAVLDTYKVRVNWFYRPREIPTRSNDSRLLYATMHSDICPLLSIRGKNVVTHRVHVKDMLAYRKLPDHFWFDKLYDRYICRFYELLPTEKILNIPANFAEILRKQVKYGVVEIGRSKDLCADARNCVRCKQWCPPDESVSCAVCGNDYHMSCVRPRLLRKPTRGFAWACAACSRERERKMRESKGKLLPEPGEDNYDDPAVMAVDSAGCEVGQNGQAADDDFSPPDLPVFKVADDKLSSEQKHEIKLWPYRYLGIHCNLEDVLENNDRIYPQAASRLGNKHQASVPEWGGQPVHFIDRNPAKTKKKKANKGLGKKVTVGATEKEEDATPVPSSPVLAPAADVEPQPTLSLDDAWVQIRPVGHIDRGGEDTATLRWKMPTSSEMPDADTKIEEFLKSAAPYATKLKMLPSSANFMDNALAALMNCGFDSVEALKKVARFTRKSLKEPTLSKEEVKKFEEGVSKYGSELRPIYKYVGTVSAADIVRFYYLWKNTRNGQSIEDNSDDKHKVDDKAVLADAVADSQDDSAFDMQKVHEKKQGFKCKFCSTTHSRAWRRAPGFAIVKTNPSVALCIRCAELWRRYAVIWEDPHEVLKKSHQRSSHGQKRKVEEEVLREIDEGNRYETEYSEEETEERRDSEPEAEVPKIAVPARRKPVVAPEAAAANESPATSLSKKKGSPMVDVAILPTSCGVCAYEEPKESLLQCHSCKMRVHMTCYGVREVPRKWRCDPCRNDRNPSISMVRIVF